MFTGGFAFRIPRLKGYKPETEEHPDGKLVLGTAPSVAVAEFSP